METSTDIEEKIAPYCTRTYSGKLIDLLDPKPEEIDFVDIGHCLSMMVRFNGGMSVPFTVGQHSFNVALDVADKVTKWSKDDARLAVAYAILHDAHETYLGDNISPFKKLINDKSGHIITTLETRFDKAIYAAAGLPISIPYDIQRLIKEADKRQYEIEKELRYDPPETSRLGCWSQKKTFGVFMSVLRVCNVYTAH